MRESLLFQPATDMTHHATNRNAAEVWADAATQILRQAHQLGFDAVGIAPIAEDDTDAHRLRQFLARGHHGGMGWLARHPDQRAQPQAYWPPARSIIMVGLSYASPDGGLAWRKAKNQGWIASFARREDYHPAMKATLGALAEFITTQYGGQCRICVDDAPVMEKPLAARAGLGWQGKHTNLVSRRAGSWLFLAACLTSLPLPAHEAEANHCGACRACLDVCPTNAFPAPYQLDARKCISYLTIEHKGAIPQPLRHAIGNRIFGCDDCLAVCPWNKFAQRSRRLAKDHLLPEIAALKLPDLAFLARLDRKQFRAFFADTGFIRLGFNRFARNLLIAIGNSANPALLPVAQARLADSSPVVRGAAVWACRQLAAPAHFAALKKNHAASEEDEEVRQEWAA